MIHSTYFGETIYRPSRESQGYWTAFVIGPGPSNLRADTLAGIRSLIRTALGK